MDKNDIKLKKQENDNLQEIFLKDQVKKVNIHDKSKKVNFIINAFFLDNLIINCLFWTIIAIELKIIIIN